MIDDIDLSRIQDENARELVERLLNLVEKLTADLRDAQAEIQRLRDEVKRQDRIGDCPQCENSRMVIGEEDGRQVARRSAAAGRRGYVSVSGPYVCGRRLCS